MLFETKLTSFQSMYSLALYCSFSSFCQFLSLWAHLRGTALLSQPVAMSRLGTHPFKISSQFSETFPSGRRDSQMNDNLNQTSKTQKPPPPPSLPVHSHCVVMRETDEVHFTISHNGVNGLVTRQKHAPRVLSVHERPPHWSPRA